MPITDVATEIKSQMFVVNSGSSSANIKAITPPSGVTITTGDNACSNSITLASGDSCTVYFTLSQIGGSGSLNLTYGSNNTLSQNITWYNRHGEALLQMTVDPSIINFTNSSESTTVTIANIGGYDLTGLTIPSPINIGVDTLLLQLVKH